jgi:glycosyltransferase involved in cell wall biosynthesis
VSTTKVDPSASAAQGPAGSPVGIASVAAVVLTFNEERNIRDCLASLTGWVEQLFVVDSGSTDGTVRIAREMGAEVLTHSFEHYGAQRNWALENCPLRARWVLNIDADERVTPEMRASIERALQDDDAALCGYLFSRRTVFMGKWIRHGGHYPAWHLRLFRVGRGRCEERLYDQHFRCDGPTRQLPGDIIDTLTPSIAVFSTRHIRWAQLEAEEQERDARGDVEASRIRGNARGNAIETRRWMRERYATLPLFVRPTLYFLYRYLVRLGFLDGVEGLIFHFLQGFWYRFLVDAMIFERRKNMKREGAAGRHKT